MEANSTGNHEVIIKSRNLAFFSQIRALLVNVHARPLVKILSVPLFIKKKEKKREEERPFENMA